MSDNTLFDALEPAPGRVIVDLAPPEETSAGGIIIAPSAQRQKNIGRVLAVGAPVDDKRVLALSPGDEILVNAAWGRQFTIEQGGEEREIHVFALSDVIGKLR